MAQHAEFQDQLSEVIAQYGRGSLVETRHLLASLRPPEIANLLESTPPKVRWVLWGLLEDEEGTQVLAHLHEDVLHEFLESMNTERLASKLNGARRKPIAEPTPAPDGTRQRRMPSFLIRSW